MKNGDILVFKVYSDYSIKKLFKTEILPDERHFETMNRIRNRLIHQRRNVGVIYIVQQGMYGLLFDKHPEGIPEGGYDSKSRSMTYEHLDHIIRITNRNKPKKADWIKIRK